MELCRKIRTADDMCLKIVHPVCVISVFCLYLFNKPVNYYSLCPKLSRERWLLAKNQLLNKSNKYQSIIYLHIFEYSLYKKKQTCSHCETRYLSHIPQSCLAIIFSRDERHPVRAFYSTEWYAILKINVGVLFIN